MSVILPLYNSAKDLPSALSQLVGQSYRNKEIILVDDGSSDETYSMASELSKKIDHIILSKTDHMGASHARNVGASKSRGAILFFAESDCVYDADYIQKAVDSLVSEPGAGAVCLTGAPLITRPTLATRCIDVENKVQHKLLREGKIRPFYAWVYRKETFTKLGGFDENLFQGEDRDLFSRLKAANYSVTWVPGVNWRHRRDQTILDMSRKWVGRGRTRVLLTLKHRQAYELLKDLLPLWATVGGILLLTLYPLGGAAVLFIVAAAFVSKSVRVASISWSEVRNKRVFLAYPYFLLVRNFSMGMGYSLALARIAVLKVQRKKLSWSKI
ncbi:MAG: glycosyltransferase [Nitrososphaerota archaeon]|nr:glycosyltransferase [Nitrososphaerota archaeon]